MVLLCTALWWSELRALAVAVGVGRGHGLVPSDSRRVVSGLDSFWGGDAPHGREASYQNGGDGIHQEAAQILHPGARPVCTEEPWLPEAYSFLSRSGSAGSRRVC